MKLFTSFVFVLGCSLAFASHARADFSFSGSGSAGSLASPSETWSINADGGAPFNGYLNNWGSPGVGQGLAIYGEGTPALGFIITFQGGGPIDAASILIGNGDDCSGTTSGGTSFCNFGTATPSLWTAFLVGPDSIDFLAQDPSLYLQQGDFYFANVFFDRAAPTSFSGVWLTNYAPTPAQIVFTPEPASVWLLGSGLMAAAAALASRRVFNHSGAGALANR